MALYSLLARCSTPGLSERNILRSPPSPSPAVSILKIRRSHSFHLPSSSNRCNRHSMPKAANALKRFFKYSESDDDVDDEDDEPRSRGSRSVADDPYLGTVEERLEMRKKIREVLALNPEVAEETDPAKRKILMQKLLADFPLVEEEDDPDWPDDADGWGFKFDQFFNNIRIKNVKKDDADDESYDSEQEVVWQDDDYIKPIKDITAGEWEDALFKDFNPCIVLVHHRYKSPKESERTRGELEKAVKLFWETGLPSPRCVAVDAVVEDELVEALHVSIFPEIIFTKAGKILHRDKVARTADEWSKIMAFFYHKAVRPPCLDKSAGRNQEKLPSLKV